MCTCLGEVYRWAKYVYYILYDYIAKRRELGKEKGTTPKNTTVALQEENFHKHLNFAIPLNANTLIFKFFTDGLYK